MIYFLTAFGFFCLACILVYFLVCLVAYLKEQFDELVYRHRIRHRLNKPPTAKCYCIDCKYHNNETGQRYRFGETTKEYRCTADNWFCWEAYPLAYIFITHLIIDLMKARYNKISYLFDQICHYITMLVYLP